jgi:hypothetical protein
MGISSDMLQSSMHERGENAYKVLFRNPKGRDCLEDLGIDGKVMLEWILGKWGGKVWTGFIWLGIGTSDMALVNRTFRFNKRWGIS